MITITITIRDGNLGLVLAALLHGLALLYMYLAPVSMPKRITTIEVEIRKPQPQPQLPPEPPITPEPPPPPVAPEPERPPPKRIVRHSPHPAVAPQPAKPPPRETPKAPSRPVFGLDASQTGGEGIAVATGNTTLADPGQRPNVTDVPPLAASSGAQDGREFRLVAEQELRRLPAHNGDGCSARMKEKWSTSQAHASGLEGEVVLRVELDDHGKVRKITKVKGLSAEIDDLTINLLRSDSRCKFAPALGKDGQPAAFVIERYAVRFENE